MLTLTCVRCTVGHPIDGFVCPPCIKSIIQFNKEVKQIRTGTHPQYKPISLLIDNDPDIELEADILGNPADYIF